MTHTLTQPETHETATRTIPGPAPIIEHGMRDLVGPGTCRFCAARLSQTFIDLGMSPLSEHSLRADQLNAMEAFYPLHVYVCERCFLVQVQEYVESRGDCGRIRHVLLVLR